MSLYNLVHGENPEADILLAALGITREDVPRYRDCYWTGEQIAIHTRTGGGNRDFYESEESCRENYPDDFQSEDAPKGPWNSDLKKLPGYTHDEDDSFDHTYATFFFTPSEHFKPMLAELHASDATPQQKWMSFFAKLQQPDSENDPQIQRVLTAIEPIFKTLANKLKK